jgi:hypothetical protein
MNEPGTNAFHVPSYSRRHQVKPRWLFATGHLPVETARRHSEPAETARHRLGLVETARRRSELAEMALHRSPS